MTELERIADQLRRAHEGDAWHGPSLSEALDGVNANSAAEKPIPGAHSIWEIVLHVTVWESVVRRRLSGEVVRTISPEEDWPVASAPTDAAWQTALDQLRAGRDQLLQTISRLTDRQLTEVVPGMNYTAYIMLHGAVQHATYHAGQIALLKKAS